MQAVSVKHIPDYLPDVPEEDERRWSLPQPLTKFIVLSMLLHTLAVMLFGAPTSGSSQGRALWGTLQVALRSVPPEPGPELKLDRKLPDWSTPAPPPTPAAAPEKPEIAIPPMLDRIITPERELRPPFQVPPPNYPEPAPVPEVAPAPAPAPPERVPAPKIEIPPPRVEVPPVPAPAIPRVAPVAPAVERSLRELPPLAAPTVAAPVIPRVAPVAPSVEPSLRELPPIPATTVAAPKLDALPVVPLPALRSPVEVPAIPLEPVAPIAVPQAAERLPSPAAAPSLKELPAVERAAPHLPDLPASLQREAPIRTEPFPAPVPAPPSQDSSRFRTAPPPSDDPTARALDLDSMRKRAAQITREGSGRKPALPFPLPPVPDKKNALELAIENARKPDCRTAYQGLLFLAAIPLIMNEFGEGNCRWGP
ncbi:hypothetical protein [Usitatibacter palustris]|uniref:Uncharacterized protein n=1 Tax=Usitatibacter palustris TaxID=2732487 RepID=A0A6M4H2L1_9PROT|nr:hypothetical protein [Usitatibacter palustris]QJR13791.1 hypothetical protein DSM104440_00581 [Usitatibacter palustris]